MSLCDRRINCVYVLFHTDVSSFTDFVLFTTETAALLFEFDYNHVFTLTSGGHRVLLHARFKVTTRGQCTQTVRHRRATVTVCKHVITDGNIDTEELIRAHTSTEAYDV